MTNIYSLSLMDHFFFFFLFCYPPLSFFPEGTVLLYRRPQLQSGLKVMVETLHLWRSARDYSRSPCRRCSCSYTLERTNQFTFTLWFL